MQGNRLSLIGHDILSALGDVLSGLHLMDETRLDDVSRTQFDRVRAAGETLDRLVCDALDCADGNAHAACTTCTENDAGGLDLRSFLRDLAHRWHGRARALDLEFDVEATDTLPSVVRVDRLPLERILSNLLDNALKHASFGRITLRVTRRGDDALAFTVCDQGPGFSDAALARLFSLGGRPADAQHPGSGLGLHISKGLADAIGGELKVVNLSECGGSVTGACVALVLPKSVWSTEGASRSTPALPALNGISVLLAEDNPTSRTLFSTMLHNLGASVTSFDTGQAACNALDSHCFDLALIDIQLPDVSGTKVIERARALGGQRPSMAIAAATAFASAADRERIYAAGADMILPKTITTLAVFGSALAGALEAASKRAREASCAAAAPKPEAKAQLQCAMPAEQFRVSQKPATRLRPVPLASELPKLVEIAGSAGEEELLRRLDDDLSSRVTSLRDAIPSRDLSSIRSDTHVLVSLTGVVGATSLHDLMAEMNSAAHKEDWTVLDRSLSRAEPNLSALCSEIRQLRQSTCSLRPT